MEAFDIETQSLTEKVVFPFTEDRRIIGLFVRSSQETEILAVSNKGDLATWTNEVPTPNVSLLPLVTDIQAVALQEHFLAVGGKGNKNPLKVFDLTDFTEPKLIHTAKSTMNTRLNTPFPVDIRAICFTSITDSSNLATANADGQIFLYDISRQASALFHRQVLPKKTVLVSLSPAEKDGSVIYTDVTGVIECYDLIKGTSYGRFKPQEGAVLSFLLLDSILITVSKDRFLRIFNYSTRTLLQKLYLKHTPTTFTVTRKDWIQASAQQYEDSDDEQVWEGMSRIPDKKRTKTSA